MNNNLISIIVPVYNGEEYLKECIDSIINQTYSNLQIILVDDGSTDNSWSIISEYVNTDSRIIALKQENQGIAAARAKGLTVASGDWIGWVDNDDFIKPDMYETLLKLAIDNKADCVYCDYEFYPKKVSAKQKWFKEYDGGVIDWRMIERNTHPWNKLISNELRHKIAMDNLISVYSDSIYLFALLMANNIVSTNEALYFYRVGHSSASGGYSGKVDYYKHIVELTRSQHDFVELSGRYDLEQYFTYRIIYSLMQLLCVSSFNKSKTAYMEGKKELMAMDYNNNPYTKLILDNNHGKVKSFVLRKLIPSNYRIAVLISRMAL